MRVDGLTHVHGHMAHHTHAQVRHEASGAHAAAAASAEAVAPAEAGAASVTGAGRVAEGGTRGAPLRVDAQRNLEHVLRAAREVFGESGYGAPMEDVARRARVGVGTVYRRFPSKDILVQRIAREETARLAEQARVALRREDEAWPALARFLRTSVASGAGRLLPPSVLMSEDVRGGGVAEEARSRGDAEDVPGAAGVGTGGARERFPRGREALIVEGRSGLGGHVPAQRDASSEVVAAHPDSGDTATNAVDPGVTELLGTVGQLVDRAKKAGNLRADVTVGDVLLVIATGAPSLPDVEQRAVASSRLLDIMIEGLRAS